MELEAGEQLSLFKSYAGSHTIQVESLFSQLLFGLHLLVEPAAMEMYGSFQCLDPMRGPHLYLKSCW